MEFAEEMLDHDVNNNSVWSFRYFIKMRTYDLKTKEVGDKFDSDFVDQEVKYVINKRLSQNWNNEAAWAYMRGMLATSE